MKYITALFVGILLLGLQENGTSQAGGLQFLGIGPEPVSLSLSESVTARNTGAASVFLNPANLTFSTQTEVNASHSFWIQNSGNSFAGVVLPRTRDAFGLGVLTSSISDIEARQTPGSPDGTFDVNYYAFAASYARKIGFLSVGVTAMYLYEQLFELSASGYGFNAGVNTSWFDDRLRVGTSVLNMGQMEVLVEERSPLPGIWKTGVWAEVIQFSVQGSSEIPVLIALGADYSLPLDENSVSDGASFVNDPWFSTGVEVTVSELLSFRAGFRTGDTKRNFSSGLGINVRNTKFSYAFVPFETGFGTVHSLGLSFFFN